MDPMTPMTPMAPMGNSTCDDAPMMMMMQMTYYWGNSVTVLFDSWDTNGNNVAYVVTLLTLLTFAVFTEFIGAVAGHFREVTRKSVGRHHNNIKKIIGTPKENLFYLCCASLYTLRFILAYQLMLAIMTYNVGVSLAIFAGTFVGNFLFARLVESNTTGEGEMSCH